MPISGLEMAKSLDFRKKIQSLTTEFPSRLSKENLRPIREPEAVTVKLIPIMGLELFGAHDLRPQVQILDWICSRTYEVGAAQIRLNWLRRPATTES